MKASEMTNEQIANLIKITFSASSSEFGAIMRNAAERLRKQDDYVEMCGDAMREVAALRAKLKVARDALNYVMSVAAIEEAWTNTSVALTAISEKGKSK